MSQCRSCGTEISWIRSKKSGKNLPIEPGFITCVLNTGDCVVGRKMHVCKQKVKEDDSNGSNQ